METASDGLVSNLDVTEARNGTRGYINRLANNKKAKRKRQKTQNE